MANLLPNSHRFNTLTKYVEDEVRGLVNVLQEILK